MNIVCVGLNHQRAPVEIREKLAFTSPQAQTLREKLCAQDVLKEAVVLSTCNRIEIYGVTQSPDAARQTLREEFLNRLTMWPDSFENILYVHEENRAIEHLIHVTCGLDSMVFGETEIFGQVKDAYEEASRGGTTSKILNRVFQKTFQAGKFIRTHTAITRGTVSVASVSVSLAEQIFGNLEASNVLVIGAGDTSEKTCRAFLAEGIQQLFITNRSPEKAQALAKEFQATSVPFEDWAACAGAVDIIVSSTSSPEYVVTHPMVTELMKLRKNKPLFFIDLAVPRDIDPEVNSIDNCYCYNMDNLQVIAGEYSALRQQEIAKCEVYIAQKVAELSEWIARNRIQGGPQENHVP
ncbi:MAG: glutamyl-tRNA reductase [Verrucomicrobiota bacterium]|nr:glutamyl-tRNA reductase [Verrucomicrobiota bacterium]